MSIVNGVKKRKSEIAQVEQVRKERERGVVVLISLRHTHTLPHTQSYELLCEQANAHTLHPQARPRFQVNFHRRASEFTTISFSPTHTHALFLLKREARAFPLEDVPDRQLLPHGEVWEARQYQKRGVWHDSSKDEAFCRYSLFLILCVCVCGCVWMW